jgi:protein-L-isoaspartate O-methyltransferase
MVSGAVWSDLDGDGYPDLVLACEWGPVRVFHNERVKLREATASHPRGVMQISPEQGAFMTMLTQLVGAKSAVEVGTFTGYSALCIARGLPVGGEQVWFVGREGEVEPGLGA